MEFWTRVTCNEPGCDATHEYWATPSIVTETDSDSYGTSSSTSVIEVSAPFGWHTEYKMWGRQFFCPVHRK